MSSGTYKAYSKHAEFCIHHHSRHHHRKYYKLDCIIIILGSSACHHKNSLVPCLPFTLSAGKNFVHVFSLFFVYFQVPPFVTVLWQPNTQKNDISVKKEKLLPRTRMDSEGTLFSWENFPIQFSPSPYSFPSR